MSGLVCPECGVAYSSIIESRPHPHGYRRRRICPGGHRFTTLEIAVSDTPRRLAGLKLSDVRLGKAKLIVRLTAILEKAL